MTLQGTPYSPDMETQPLVSLPMGIVRFLRMVRDFLRDHPHLNRLQEGEAHSDRLMVWAVIATLEDFNLSPPPIRVAFEQIPKLTLLYGVVAFLLESEAILSTRNSLQYTDGQISVNLDKAPQLLQMAGMMRSYYTQQRDRVKISLNAMRAFGKIESEYAIANSLWGVL